MSPATVRIASERSRLVQIGPTRWELATWAAGLCVFCPADLARGDQIACATHRARMEEG